MKILFCTSVFNSSENGPAKFSKFLLNLNHRENIKLEVLTEDIVESDSIIHKLDSHIPIFLKPIGFIYKMYLYGKRVHELNKLHNYDIIWFNNVIEGFYSAKINKHLTHVGMINDDNSINASVKTYGFSYKFIRHFIFRFFEKNAFKRFDKIIANSIYLSKSITENYYQSNGKLAILLKAIETNITITNNLNFSNSKEFKILFVKTDFQRGGLLELLEALTILPYSFQLTIVGPSIERLQKTIDLGNISPNISLICKGSLNQQAVFKLLLENHIFCTPSRMEALGVANMEALIHKTPVVYTNIGGIPEVMNYGENGFAAEPNNPKSIANAILECIKNDELRKHKQIAGYIYVKNNFDKEKMLDNFLSICTNLKIANS